MPLDPRHAVLVNEPSLLGLNRFPTSRAYDGLWFSEEHVGLIEG